MSKPHFVTYCGQVPSLSTTLIEVQEHPPDLIVGWDSFARRYSVQAIDEGLDNYGVRTGDFVVFREQRWPTRDGQVCLVTFGDEVTMRVLEYTNNPEVTIRVASDQIPPVEMSRNDFTVIGVLDGVISEDQAQLIYPDTNDELDWGA